MVGIIVANSMLGELTIKMARAIAESPAKKVILPLNRCNIEIVGVDKTQPMPHLIDEAIQRINEYVRGDKNVRSQCISD
jgi:hypothetical protein